MIVVDTSAIMAIILEEELARPCEDALVAADRRLIAATTLTEALIVATAKDRLDLWQSFWHTPALKWLSGMRIEHEPLSLVMRNMVSEAK